MSGTKCHLRRNKIARAKSRGSALVEFAVAFMVLVLLMLFPAINLLCIFSIYVAASTLNEIQSHEASLYDYETCLDPRGPIKRGIPAYWKSSGLGAYAKSVGRIDTKVRYEFASISKYGLVDQWVDVTTTLSLRPFLSVSYLPIHVPGLTTEFDVSIRSRKLVEDSTNAPPVAPEA